MSGEIVNIAERKARKIPPAPKRRPIDIVRKEYHDELRMMFNRGEKPPCEGRDKYFTDYPPEDRPTPDQADLMCRMPDGRECPARRLHDELARMEKPDRGVIGGNVWHNKKLVREEIEEVEAA